jgi:ATP-dependent DNA helicase RecG
MILRLLYQLKSGLKGKFITSSVMDAGYDAHHISRVYILILIKGDIYIGVDDNGEIVGLSETDKHSLAIIDRIKNNILPGTLGFFDVSTINIEDKKIIHIIVTRGTEKPYYLKKYGLSPIGSFIRIGTGVQQLSPSMIDRLYSSRTRNSLRNIP